MNYLAYVPSSSDGAKQVFIKLKTKYIDKEGNPHRFEYLMYEQHGLWRLKRDDYFICLELPESH